MSSLSELATDERTARMVLSMLVGPNNPVTGRILAHLGAVETLWLAERDGAVAGLSAVNAQVWRDRFRAMETNDLAMRIGQTPQSGVRALIPGDFDWPAALSELGDVAPYVLWARGSSYFLARPLQDCDCQSRSRLRPPTCPLHCGSAHAARARHSPRLARPTAPRSTAMTPQPRSAAIASTARSYSLEMGVMPGNSDDVPGTTLRDPGALVRRLVLEVMVGGNFDVLPELVVTGEVEPMRRWIEPFRRSFPDLRMEILTVVAEGQRVAAHFRCSGTHLGRWRGHEPTGARFEDVDELYFFLVDAGRLHGMVSVEDNESRLSQLGLGSALARGSVDS